MVTTCSAGKRCRERITIDALARGSQAAVARQWTAALRREDDLVAAVDLYKGRAFQTAKEAALRAGASFGVISAGLGYVVGETAIPGYDLTLRSVGPASVRHKIEGGLDPARWWREVNAGPFASDFVQAARSSDLVLMSLSRAYADMIVEDLVAVAEARPGVLRLFGQALERALPDALRPYVMPYDVRFERLKTPGTRSDFAPRVLKHFIDVVLPQVEIDDLEAQKAVVRKTMEGAPPAEERRPQCRVSDGELRGVIVELRSRGLSTGALILRALRRELHLSCEQARFARLYRSVQAEGAIP